ncbi:MAG: N-acetyl-gamma-glutamyl-phosphate reductase [Alphaproteobacteria bacterium]|nr:N-acetyl-gamma-glutamyl-phosphate reductase [Alphaproteobacteria bacterium]
MSGKIKVYVDGQVGTTGLQIIGRLSKRDDIDILFIPEDLRKNDDARRDYLNKSDVSFLCLSDANAVKAASMVENPNTVIIDASTAHRTNPDWVYGLPEIGAQRKAIRGAKRIANPGCHASGFISIVYPLVFEGVIARNQALSCFSITGYSGGGKELIAEYENSPDYEDEADYLYRELDGAQLYALGLVHKHLDEMRHMCGLLKAPVFVPILNDVAQGMTVSVPLSLEGGDHDAVQIHQFLAEYYKDAEFVKVMPFAGKGCLNTKRNTLSSQRCNGTNRMELFVFGHSNHAVVSAVFDNLGAGAGGQAMHNMNIALGIEEAKGLVR